MIGKYKLKRENVTDFINKKNKNFSLKGTPKDKNINKINI